MPLLTSLRWLALALICALPVQAASFESIFMPGALIEGHAKYEGQCAKCHNKFDKSHRARLCLDCHKRVAGDVQQGLGFHGRISGIKQRECSDCHSDHLGRKVDITRLNRATFPHDRTDFPLQGRHRFVACAACHKAPGAFFKAPLACIACHRRDDPHDGKLGRKCARCHGLDNWQKVARFNHKKTDFPLRGAHKKTSCKACHPNERYTKVARQCYSCHRIHDRHRGILGRKCQDCHNEKSWKKPRFSHTKDTRYPLRGVHRKLRCEACHEGNVFKEKLGEKCISCHAKDDEHKTQFGKKCADCHSENAWDRIKFDHQKDTDFRLRGRHKTVQCTVCHQAEVHTALKHQCIACHQLDDVHSGKLGRDCQRCHAESAWSQGIRFDHGLTRFPLLGLHAMVPCEDCHIDQSFVGTSRQCLDCHKTEDTHKQRLGSDCAQCHTPNDWAVWRFDHNQQSRFKLDGAHARVACYDCHFQKMNKQVRAPKQCVRCHADDDPHQGGFGTHCARCHVTRSFKDISFTR